MAALVTARELIRQRTKATRSSRRDGQSGGTEATNARKRAAICATEERERGGERGEEREGGRGSPPEPAMCTAPFSLFFFLMLLSRALFRCAREKALYAALRPSVRTALRLYLNKVQPAPIRLLSPTSLSRALALAAGFALPRSGRCAAPAAAGGRGRTYRTPLLAEGKQNGTLSELINFFLFSFLHCATFYFLSTHTPLSLSLWLFLCTLHARAQRWRSVRSPNASHFRLNDRTVAL